MRSRSAAGAGFILLAALLWGMFGPVARIALREGVMPIEIGFWRTVIAGVLFATHVAVVRNALGTGKEGPTPRRIARTDLPALLLFALTGIAALYAFLPLAIEAGGATLAAVLLYTAPAWVALLAWPLLDERLSWRKLLALGLTIAGISGIALSGDGASRPTPAALGWGLAAGLSYASLYLFGKRFFVRYGSPIVFVSALPIATVALLPFTEFAAKSAQAWLAIIVLGVVCTYAAYLAYGAGLTRIEATRASTIATAEPVIAALLAFAFWGERLSVWGYLGAAIVIAGVLLMVSAPEDLASAKT